ncbi:uncharacterized protein LOC107054821 [Gallus gallus]|uniref:uncharacterized protein LOC107054821 n=1 Tax=Gallus gallus TaxID=9031 RepID=UPI001F02557B|nr:uncharacterized protein LOC107054821 [Gallus gallus]XP_046786936.1 uncharacterized protein LOC107054821 [Gallus gallus]
MALRSTPASPAAGQSGPRTHVSIGIGCTLWPLPYRNLMLSWKRWICRVCHQFAQQFPKNEQGKSTSRQSQQTAPCAAPSRPKKAFPTALITVLMVRYCLQAVGWVAYLKIETGCKRIL